MANFYLVEELDSANVGDEIVLGASESRHIVTVSRTRVGDRLAVGNGRGLAVHGTVLSAAPDAVVVRVEAAVSTPPVRPRVILVQALAKGDRDELAIQAATELGVDAVVPWSAARSVSRWDGQKAVKGRERWAAIVREATKQSMRPWLPVVEALAVTADLERHAGQRRMLVLEPRAELALSALVLHDRDRPDDRDLELIVGPEGGITDQELVRLVAAGARPVRLGGTILRTSTAGPAAIAVLNALLGRW
ncbi:16S rRNA (uracil(1498)-N(3))-methyltransferase [Rathayibacter soli]|uniref:16S rRNA (uracil(1498)-N(3))-methyltransferase n=1 Tax=Rathayibacter soli TaxID=3144168 RepID=UPI0027E447CE|nr:16S rRNA (uracil(1498)-N(3))-methyltransferase [Glaciibacter superstes]